MNNTLVLFYSPKPRTQVRILNIENGLFKYNIAGLNTASSRRQPVTSVAKDLNWGRPRTSPASGESGTRTLDRRITIRTRRPPRHAAS